MGDAKSILKQWAVQFLRSKDAFFRKIAGIENPVPNADFAVKYKDGRYQFYIVLPALDAAPQALSHFLGEHHLAIITLNNRHNRQKLAELWSSLTPYKLLSVYFANPFSSQEKKWVIMPHVHAKVCDERSLAAGFSSLGELVEDISEEEAAVRS